MPKLILITGATSGFGEATARRFSAEGHRVIITGRRKERLEALRQGTGRNARQPRGHDRRSPPALRRARQRRRGTKRHHLPPAWSAIDVLVNNAGLAAGLDPIQEGHLEDWERMLDTNVKGLLHVSKAVIPGMIARKTGHIINIGSTAGKEVYPKGNVYCASKHAVDALTKGLRQDLLPHGIKVTQIAPGLAETEFSVVRFHGDEDRARQVYHGLHPLRPEDVAELVYYVTTLPAHVCVNDLVVTPTAQANSHGSAQ
ncbi:MAG: SDR family NAD(P)-dependent oxidoreductase [Flavobacteriales bacterium]|nr:SDR family NAD(P)-dependent oxidoreductase [Flavobacteriales bacterium]